MLVGLGSFGARRYFVGKCNNSEFTGFWQTSHWCAKLIQLPDAKLFQNILLLPSVCVCDCVCWYHSNIRSTIKDVRTLIHFLAVSMPTQSLSQRLSALHLLQFLHLHFLHVVQWVAKNGWDCDESAGQPERCIISSSEVLEESWMKLRKTKIYFPN